MGPGRLPRRWAPGWLRWWVAGGWVLAAVAAAASSCCSVFVVRAPIVSGLDPAQVQAYATTTVDPWGGSTTTTNGVGLSFELQGGPNYAVAILPCALVLLAAGAAALLRRSPRPLWASATTTVVAPVAAGALGAFAVCQLLAYEAAVRPSPPGGLYGGGELRPEGSVGWSPWFLAVSALMGVTSYVLHQPPRAAPVDAAAPAMSPPEAPAPPGPVPPPVLHHRPGPATHLDPALFRRPVPDRHPDEG